MSPERQPMSSAEEGRRRRVSEANKARAEIRPLVFPLASRRVPRSEIVKITNLKPRQVNSAIYRMGLKDEIDRPSKKETSEAHRRSLLGRKRAESRSYTAKEQHAFALAREFLVAGFIGDDLTFWNKLHKIYADDQRELPYNYADRVRLEVFLAATIRAKIGDGELLTKYQDFGNSVDSVWFRQYLTEEEEFIRTVQSKKVAPQNGNGVLFRLDDPAHHTKIGWL